MLGSRTLTDKSAIGQVNARRDSVAGHRVVLGCTTVKFSENLPAEVDWSTTSQTHLALGSMVLAIMNSYWNA